MSGQKGGDALKRTLLLLLLLPLLLLLLLLLPWVISTLPVQTEGTRLRTA